VCVEKKFGKFEVTAPARRLTGVQFGRGEKRQQEKGVTETEYQSNARSLARPALSQPSALAASSLAYPVATGASGSHV
jgi:hypothetical protein